ncbi:MAG: PEP-CTERM sorting domain-containing protein [Sedimentisphaerales bacterium]|nr:PEP-CTERM sorting domain-containing protein [Sedimentisphaerales bacterium]
MKTVLAILTAGILVGCLTLAAQADDTELIVFDFSAVGEGASQTAGHNDADPWKGLAYISVTNTGTEPWGDFHFQIVGVGIENVSFGMTDFSSSQTLDSAPVIDNVVVGATMDLYFYNDPVQPTETATFTIYTDNTIDKNSYFGLCMYPTPVPEPMTMGLLGLGAMALLRRKSA